MPETKEPLNFDKQLYLNINTSIRIWTRYQLNFDKQLYLNLGFVFLKIFLTELNFDKQLYLNRYETGMYEPKSLVEL